MSASRAARSAPQLVSAGSSRSFSFATCPANSVAIHSATAAAVRPSVPGASRPARYEPAGQVRQCVVLGGQRADQVAAAGLGGRRPVEGAFLRLGMGQDLFFQVVA